MSTSRKNTHTQFSGKSNVPRQPWLLLSLNYPVLAGTRQNIKVGRVGSS